MSESENGVTAWIHAVDTSMTNLKQKVGMILDGYACEAVSPMMLEKILGEIGTVITEHTSEPQRVSCEVWYGDNYVPSGF